MKKEKFIKWYEIKEKKLRNSLHNEDNCFYKIWFWYFRLDPNYPDYFRGVAWSVSASLFVTVILKIESWSWLVLGLLTISSIFFFLATNRFTSVWNFIKKYQSKQSDEKLITRGKNNFSEQITENEKDQRQGKDQEQMSFNVFPDLHKVTFKNKTIEKNYPEFLDLKDYLVNIANRDKFRKKYYPLTIFFAFLYTLLGIGFLVWAAWHAKADVKTAKQHNSNYEVKQMERIVDSIKKIKIIDTVYIEKNLQIVDTTANSKKTTKRVR